MGQLEFLSAVRNQVNEPLPYVFVGRLLAGVGLVVFLGVEMERKQGICPFRVVSQYSEPTGFAAVHISTLAAIFPNRKIMSWNGVRMRSGLIRCFRNFLVQAGKIRFYAGKGFD